MNDEMKALCVENFGKILAVHGQKGGLKNVSDRQIEDVLAKIADRTILGKGAVSRRIKHLLCNLERLRPDVRSDLEPKIFEIWQAEFQEMFPVKTGPAPEPASDPEPEPEPEPEPQAAEKAETLPSTNVVPEAERSAFVFKKRRRDWFDAVLDVAALIMSPFSKW